MSFKIVRNDITKMNTQAIVNTANKHPVVGSGCDIAIYQAAGYDKLLEYRKKHIGDVKEGEAFITPGFGLKARYIIHTVSPKYIDGSQGEEERLRSCYRNSLKLAKERKIKSIAFPLIATGGFGYPKEEGMRIAVDEIHAFLLGHEMEIYLVVFDQKATVLGGKLYPDLETYIDQHYIEEKYKEEYLPQGKTENIRNRRFPIPRLKDIFSRSLRDKEAEENSTTEADSFSECFPTAPFSQASTEAYPDFSAEAPVPKSGSSFFGSAHYDDADFDFYELHESKLEERMRHRTDTFSQYLLYLIQLKNMGNAEVYKRAIVDKKIFSKIKNNIDYHPQKLTALCLCIGAKLNLDEAKDLLARAGYALSPCDKTDIIFSYFIENEIYDMIELDIQLEEHGLPCIIS